MDTSCSRPFRIEVTFEDRALSKPVIDMLLKDADVSVTLLRGSITGRGAWFLLELSGDARRVDEIMMLSRTWGSYFRDEREATARERKGGQSVGVKGRD